MADEALTLTDYVFLTLLVVHILAIVGWMGAAFLFSSVLGPSLSKMEAGGRAEFLSKVIPRYTRYVMATSLTAVVFGVALYGYAFEYSKNLPAGIALTLLQAGAVVGLVALIVSLALVIPTARTLGRMLNEGKSGAPQPPGQAGLMTALQSRVRIGTISVTGLLFLVLVLMVVGASL
jgi:uncharacterized membrane protein